MACSTSSGMVVGPGRARNSLPARTVIWVFLVWISGHAGMAGRDFKGLLSGAFMQNCNESGQLSIAHGIGDFPPYLVLDLGCQRARKNVHRRGVFPARLDQAQDPHFTVRVIEIAAAVAAGE